MKYKIPLFIIFQVLFCTLFFAQSTKIDSLKAELRKNKRNKFETSNLLAWEYVTISPDSLKYYNDYSKRHLVNERDKGRYLVLKGTYFYLIEDYSKALRIINQSISLASKNQDYMTLGACYNVISNIKQIEGDFHESCRYSKIAMNYSLRTKDRSIILKAIINYGSTLVQDNRYEEGISYYKLGERYFYEGGEYEKGVLYLNLGIAFSARNEYEKAIIYLKKGTFYLHKSNAKRWYCSCWLELSEIYISIKNQKKARFYLKKASKCISSEYENSNLNFLYAQYYKNMSEFDQAKTYLQKSIAIDSIMNQSKLGEDYLVMAELSIAAKNYGEAEKQLKNAVTIFKINHEEENLKSAYHLLIKNFLYTSKSDEHLTYFNEYMKLSEKIDHINNSKALLDLDKKYKTAEKESQIKSQQIQIQKDETIKLITFGVFGFSLLLVGSGFIWYNNRQKRKKLELQNKLLGMNQSLSMMELSVLNKQLDPHEIKNILASISPEIQEKAPDAYLRMLKLLNLIKASLNSNSFTESIENQIQQSKDYLFLENSMLEKSIALSIDLKIENKEFQIPRLLLKNLVENAIKHGLKNKKHDKAIQLLLEENESMVSIKVIDNGTWLDNTNHTISGIGISTYIKLFELLNRKNSQNASFNIDLEDNKTCVSVSIPKNYSWL